MQWPKLGPAARVVDQLGTNFDNATDMLADAPALGDWCLSRVPLRAGRIFEPASSGSPVTA